MKYGSLIIDSKENDRLIEMIGMSHNRRDATYQSSIAKVLDELKIGIKVNADEIPDDVVRFNSVVEVALPDGKVRKMQIVLPEKSDVSADKISILSPMGLALIGYAADDEVVWRFPSGMQSIKILSVVQAAPEAKIAD